MASAFTPGRAPPDPAPPPYARHRRPIGPRLLGGAAVALLIAGIWWASTQQATFTRQSAEDSVLIPVVTPQTPPPPPEVKPEPKPEEIPPQPVNQSQPSPQQPSPAQAATPSQGQAVSINGPAQAGGDAFNIGSGPGGGSRGSGAVGSGIGGFNRAAYASYLQGELQRILASGRDRSLAKAIFNVPVQAWIDASGKITRVELGDSDKAQAIRAALIGRSVRAPDASLPMPVRFRLESRRGG